MSSGLLVRMTAPIAVVSLLLLAVGAVAAWYVHRLQKNISDILDVNVSSVRAAEELEIGIREVRTQLIYFLFTGDRKYLEAFPALHQHTDRWLGEADRLATTPYEQEVIARVKKGHARFLEGFNRLSQQAPAAETPQRLREQLEDVLTNEILRPAHAYLDFNEEVVKRTSEQNQVMADRMALGLLLLGTCGAVAGLLAGYGLARTVSHSIVQLSVPIRNAAGILNEVVGPITLSAGGGFAELEAVLRRIAGEISTVVQRLQQSQREVLRAEQLAAVGQLAAGLAHELRNPLMAMKILVQSAAERGEPAGLAGRDLAVLEEEITRLERSVQTFLDFARPPRPEKRAVEVRHVLEQTAGLVARRAERQGVRLEWDLPAAPAVLEADVGQLRQVLLNLLLNALEAVPGGGTVRVEAAGPEGPGGEAVADRDLEFTIRVADTGCGLPADLGERIFEPFVSTKETGLGLGLSICKRIVEAHGGDLTAANRPGGGAVFTVRLPLVATAAPREPQP
jgi:signal transduction histidine kinase